jgi:hypothetical protein
MPVVAPSRQDLRGDGTSTGLKPFSRAGFLSGWPDSTRRVGRFTASAVYRHCSLMQQIHLLELAN